MPRFLRLQEGWLTVGLLALLLFSVTLSIQQAQWADGLTILTPVTIIGLASGIVLAKVKGVPRFLLDLVGLLLGVITILVAVASIMNDSSLITIQDKVQNLFLRTGSWVGVAIRQEMSDDLLVFIMSLALVSWVLAYSSAYFVFRSRQLWWALVPNGIALLINLSYATVNLNSYIIIFMFSALLLMIRFNLLLQEERWQRERVNYSPALAWGFLWAGSLASVVVAGAMWYVPATAVNSTLSGMWNQVNRPWVDFQTRMSALWAQVPGNQVMGGYSSFNSRFTMGGALNLSDSIALTVKSSERLYWRAISYDQYNGIGWTNTAPETLTGQPNSSSKLSLDANQQLVSEDQARKPVTYTVNIVHPKDDILFAASRPVLLSLPSRLNVSWHTLDAVYSVDSTSPSAVPLELRTLMSMLGSAQRELRGQNNTDESLDPLQRLYATSVGPQLQNQVETLDKRGIKVTFDVAPGDGYKIDLRASGEIPVYDDLTSVHTNGALRVNSQYTVTSLKSEATDEQLRVADTKYEQWISDRYLNLPATVPQRVRDKAEEVVAAAGATNNYDKAKAIETYLRQNFKYNTNITLPPAGMDRVDWFLFQGKEGYCEYYASAMVVMLRSLGIPARMAAGYAPGVYDTKTSQYIVRESSAHTWPEVYFTGYGWIEFEPTPSQAASVHQVLTDVPTVEPTPQSTVSTTPTEVDPLKQKNLDDRQQPLGGTDSTFGGDKRPIAVGLMFVLGLFAVALTWWVSWFPWSRVRQRRIGRAGDYYGRMLRWARLLGIGPAAHQTPYEFGESVAREVPGTALFTRSITRAYVRERFSREELDVSDRVASLRAWDSLRSRLFRALPGRQIKRAMPRTRRR